VDYQGHLKKYEGGTSPARDKGVMQGLSNLQPPPFPSPLSCLAVAITPGEVAAARSPFGPLHVS